MNHFAYELAEESVPTLGLIVLQVDETLESDFRRLFLPDEVRLHITRIPSGADLTPDTIAQMAVDLPSAASLFPAAPEFGVIGYGCTSGATLIGPERVGELVRGVVRTDAVTDPLTAAKAAFRALGRPKIGLVTPYIPSVAEPIREAFESDRLSVTQTLSFGEEVEARVARIAPRSIRAAALEVASRGEVEAFFLSCTNLRTFGIIDDLERETGLPVMSSNRVLAWHMAQLAGAPLHTPWATRWAVA